MSVGFLSNALALLNNLGFLSKSQEKEGSKGNLGFLYWVSFFLYNYKI
jgi:hypothetical protein